MAKRHHASKRARRDEHMGMERYERGPVRHHGRRSQAEHERHLGGHGYRHEMEGHSPVPNVVHGDYRMRDREQYAGREQTRRMMARDGAMIHDDWNAPALLPQHVIEKYWPRAHNYNMGMVDDLFSGVQYQMHEDYDDMGREMNPKKY
jgi:hypothetical protein